MKTFIYIIILGLLSVFCYFLYNTISMTNNVLNKKDIKIINGEAMVCVPFYITPDFSKTNEIH